ncbi:MAG: hypothetical protein QCI82_09770 [Candidatus Thermoplasmatota archaeon]|nr:hypothetical protein [Candidatus Thermoplasmatota archaeon]
MAVNNILIIGLIVGSVFIIGLIGLMASAGHEAADDWFGHDHHDGEECEEHHHFYEFWDNDHHHGHHHDENDHDECLDEENTENGTVAKIN